MKRLFVFVFLFITTPLLSQNNSLNQSQRIDTLLQNYTDLDQFSGSVLVARRGYVILAKGYGLANREWNIPATSKTRFRIASLSKHFTAMLIMQLKQVGKLDLNAPITKYLTWYPKEIGDKVTIHHLLTHTSGIPNYTNRPDFFTVISRQEFPTKTFVEKYCADALEFTPGTKFSYSNTGYFILGAVIEAITHKKYGEVLKEQIFDVIGMKSSGNDDPVEIIPDRAMGYENPYGTYENARFINNASTIGAAGSIYSTVEDFYIWDRALYSDKLLSAENKKIMFSPFLSHYAYGIGVEKILITNEKDSLLLMAHTGGINGFRSKILRIIDTEEVIVVFSNTSDDYTTTDVSTIALNVLLAMHGHPCSKPLPHIVTETAKRVLKGSASEGIAFFKSAKRSDTYDFTNAENHFDNFGRYLSNHGRQKDAIAILQLNVEQYPNSSGAYDSYADELAEDNQFKEAIVNYRKALSLNPKNEHAKRELERLEKELN